MIHMTPAGYRCALLTIAYLKRTVQDKGTSEADKLQLLEVINDSADHYISRDMIAAVAPMGDIEIAASASRLHLMFSRGTRPSDCS